MGTLYIVLVVRTTHELYRIIKAGFARRRIHPDAIPSSNRSDGICLQAHSKHSGTLPQCLLKSLAVSGLVKWTVVHARLASFTGTVLLEQFFN